jgi:hypothetical protein
VRFGLRLGVNQSSPLSQTQYPGLPPSPDQVAVLFLSHDPVANSGDGTDTRCPIAPAVSDVGGAAVFDKALFAPKLDPAQLTGRGMAFHVWTDNPVSVYSMVPDGGALSDREMTSFTARQCR